MAGRSCLRGGRGEPAARCRMRMRGPGWAGLAGSAESLLQEGPCARVHVRAGAAGAEGPLLSGLALGLGPSVEYEGTCGTSSFPESSALVLLSVVRTVLLELGPLTATSLSTRGQRAGAWSPGPKGFLPALGSVTEVTGAGRHVHGRRLFSTVSGGWEAVWCRRGEIGEMGNIGKIGKYSPHS